MYLTIPTVAILGLTEFSVRFANALFGTFTVITTYFLTKELFKRRDIAIISMFLMAISPWSIQFSRFAHEGMVGLEFNFLMILFFIKSLNKPIYLSLSAVFAALSLYSYQNEKVFVPLLLIVLFVAYFKKLVKIPKKYFAYAFITGLVLSLPILLFTLTNPEALTRARGASFLNKPNGVLSDNHFERILIDTKNKDYVGLAFDNRRVEYAKTIIGNYLSHYDPNFLFIKGDTLVARHQATGMGHLYLLELPFLLIGFYFLVFGKFQKESKIFVVLWMLIVPLSASITWDVPNSGRTMNFLPTFQMIIGIGIVAFYDFVMRQRVHKAIKYSIFGILGILAVFNFVYYYNQYFVQYRYFDSQAWQYGYDQIIPAVKKAYPNYKKIVIDTRLPLDQSYIFFLYNLKYSPQKYQAEFKNGKNESDGKFDKFDFHAIKQNEWLESDSSTLFIGPNIAFPNEAEKNTLKKIYFLDGTSYSKIVKGRNK